VIFLSTTGKTKAQGRERQGSAKAPEDHIKASSPRRPPLASSRGTADPHSALDRAGSKDSGEHAEKLTGNQETPGKPGGGGGLGPGAWRADWRKSEGLLGWRAEGRRAGGLEAGGREWRRGPGRRRHEREAISSAGSFSRSGKPAQKKRLEARVSEGLPGCHETPRPPGFAVPPRAGRSQEIAG
jgi:hypothetical protein